MKEHKRGLERKASKKKKILIILIGILIIIASIIFYILRSNTADLEEITDYEYDNKTIENQVTEPEENEQEEGIEIVDVSEMPSRANGYKVMGQIVLEKIGIQCYIFDTSSKAEREAALKVGTVRFEGPEVNEPRKSMHRRA